MNLAERLAEYSASLAYGDIGGAVVLEAKKRLLDTLGCAIGALVERPVKVVFRLAKEGYRGDAATIMGTRTKTTPEMATFVNGLMIRYFDFNDTYLSKEPAHPSDNVSACLATAEMEGRSGKDLLLAMVLAYELQCRLCDAASLRMKGWDHVCYGLVSSALAAGRLMALSKGELSQAVNLSLSSHLAMRQVRAGPRGDKRTLSRIRGGDGLLPPGLGTFRVGHGEVRREGWRALQTGGDLHQVLSSRVSRAVRHLGGH
jgi:2-methylcitrate dehydratase